MPTRWRSARRSVCGSLTMVPSNRMRPPWIGSSPLMPRSMVLLPDPERPITAMISPGATSSETSSSTVFEPKRLTTCDSSTSDMQPPLQVAAPLRWRDRGERAATDLPEERAGIDRERRRGRDPRIDDEADERKAEIEQEQP